jgi:polyphosphate kinase 2
MKPVAERITGLKEGEFLSMANNNHANGTQELVRKKLKGKEYQKALRHLQTKLVLMQEWVKATGAKVVVVFEGRDAAGKGGVINTIMQRVSPRVVRHVALPAPNDREKTQLYAQRYMAHLPAAGEVILFDRSWYNRALVEHVMGFATRDQYEEFLRVCPSFEAQLQGNGTRLIKYWFEVTEKEQRRRFLKRIQDPMRQWKLSPMDLESHHRWYDYSRAKDAMFAATDNQQSPWYVVQTDDKERARLNCISHLLSVVPWKEIHQEKIKLPKRQKRHGYKEPDWNYRWIPEKY